MHGFLLADVGEDLLVVVVVVVVVVVGEGGGEGEEEGEEHEEEREASEFHCRRGRGLSGPGYIGKKGYCRM